MTLYLKLKVKSLLTDPELIGWSILFIEFWVFMWLFIFSSGVSTEGPYGEYVVKVNATLAYSFLGLLSMSSAAIGLTYSVYYMSRPLRFITKFTKMTPFKFIIEDFIGGLAVLIINALIIMASVLGLTYLKWGVIALPDNFLGVFAGLLLGGTALYWLSYVVALALIVARRTRGISMASSIPLILGFAIYSQLWIDLGNAAYAVPLATLPAILLNQATGLVPSTGSYLAWLITRVTPNRVNLWLALVSVLVWIAIFMLLSVALIKKSRGIALEELRT